MTDRTDLTPAATSPGQTRRAWIAFAIFLLLAAAHTWPLASDPGHLSRNDNGDTQLNTWIIAWIAHRLPSDPIHLFDANIFHPERHTLAYSEPLIVPGLLGAPLLWMGASPVLTYNVLLIVGFALTAQGMYLLARTLTGDHVASLLGGALLAFNPHTVTRLPHLQAIHAVGLPIALLALVLLLSGARTRDALLLAFGLTSLALTSGYLSMMGLVAIGTALVVSIDGWWRRRRPIAGRLAVAGGITAVVVLPILAPYAAVHDGPGLVRPLDEVTRYSALPIAYLITPARLHYELWSHALWGRSDALFPGLTASFLALCGLMAGRRLGPLPVTRILGAIGLVGFLLSLGTGTPLYGWLYRAFPPMEGLRAASRFGFLLLFAVAGLAAIGLAAARREWRTSRWIGPASGLALLLVNLEILVAPVKYVPFSGIPPIYDLVAREPSAVLVEMPYYPDHRVFMNAGYVLASTAHWKPILNGYSGFVPDSYRRRTALTGFPLTVESFRELYRSDATHVMVHLDRYDPEVAEQVVQALDARDDLELIGRATGVRRLYRLRRAPVQRD